MLATHESLLAAITGILTVEPGGLHHFDLQVPASGVAGQPFTMTITARNQFSSTLTTFASDVLLSTSNGGTISPTLIPSVVFISGVWTGSVTLSDAGDDQVLRADGGGGSGIATIDILPAEKLVFLPLVLSNH